MRKPNPTPPAPPGHRWVRVGGDNLEYRLALLPEGAAMTLLSGIKCDVCETEFPPTAKGVLELRRDRPDQGHICRECFIDVGRRFVDAHILEPRELLSESETWRRDKEARSREESAADAARGGGGPLRSNY